MLESISGVQMVGSSSGEKRKESLPEYFQGVPIGEIIRAIRSIQHGNVQIIVQDSKVIQVDKTEKKKIIYKTDNDYSI